MKDAGRQDAALADDASRTGTTATPAHGAPDSRRVAPRQRRMEFFAVLFAVFAVGWVASYVGSVRGVEWLYFAGLSLVGLPLLILVAWLGH